MLIPKKNRREVYKYLFKGEIGAAASAGAREIRARLLLLLLLPGDRLSRRELAWWSRR